MYEGGGGDSALSPSIDWKGGIVEIRAPKRVFLVISPVR
jgi:hypothetical protein